MRVVHRCCVLWLGALLLAGCSSSYEYDHRLAQARAEHQDARETAPQPARHARKGRHGPRVRTARRKVEPRGADPLANKSFTTGAVLPPANGGGLRPIRTSAQINAYLRDRMRRPSPIVNSPEWNIEKAADERRERQIDHTIHSICNGC